MEPLTLNAAILFSCGMCGRRFPKPELCLAHIKIHTGQQPFSCLVCWPLFPEACTTEVTELNSLSKEKSTSEKSSGDCHLSDSEEYQKNYERAFSKEYNNIVYSDKTVLANECSSVAVSCERISTDKYSNVASSQFEHFAMHTPSIHCAHQTENTSLTTAQPSPSLINSVEIEANVDCDVPKSDLQLEQTDLGHSSAFQKYDNDSVNQNSRLSRKDILSSSQDNIALCQEALQGTLQETLSTLDVLAAVSSSSENIHSLAAESSTSENIQSFAAESSTSKNIQLVTAESDTSGNMQSLVAIPNTSRNIQSLAAVSNTSGNIQSLAAETSTSGNIQFLDSVPSTSRSIQSLAYKGRRSKGKPKKRHACTHSDTDTCVPFQTASESRTRLSDSNNASEQLSSMPTSAGKDTEFPATGTPEKGTASHIECESMENSSLDPFSPDSVCKQNTCETPESNQSYSGLQQAELQESPHIELKESAHVELQDSPHVELNESTHVQLQESLHVELKESPHVELQESVHVQLQESVHVQLQESAHVQLQESVYVGLKETVYVGLKDSGQISKSFCTVKLERLPKKYPEMISKTEPKTSKSEPDKSKTKSKSPKKEPKTPKTDPHKTKMSKSRLKASPKSNIDEIHNSQKTSSIENKQNENNDAEIRENSSLDLAVSDFQVNIQPKDTVLVDHSNPDITTSHCLSKCTLENTDSQIVGIVGKSSTLRDNTLVMDNHYSDKDDQCNENTFVQSEALKIVSVKTGSCVNNPVSDFSSANHTYTTKNSSSLLSTSQSNAESYTETKCASLDLHDTSSEDLNESVSCVVIIQNKQPAFEGSGSLDAELAKDSDHSVKIQKKEEPLLSVVSTLSSPLTLSVKKEQQPASNKKNSNRKRKSNENVTASVSKKKLFEEVQKVNQTKMPIPPSKESKIRSVTKTVTPPSIKPLKRKSKTSKEANEKVSKLHSSLIDFNTSLNSDLQNSENLLIASNPSIVENSHLEGKRKKEMLTSVGKNSKLSETSDVVDQNFTKEVVNVKSMEKSTAKKQDKNRNSPNKKDKRNSQPTKSSATTKKEIKKITTKKHLKEESVKPSSCENSGGVERIAKDKSVATVTPLTASQGAATQQQCATNGHSNVTGKAENIPFKRIKGKRGRKIPDDGKFRPYKCKICDSRFLKKSILSCHMVGHKHTNDIQCDICGLTYTRMYSLKIHRMIHTGEAAVDCSVCGKQLSTVHALQIHMRLHTDERPYSCPHCPKTFRQRPSLNSHLRTHTKERPFVCEICGKCFPFSKSLYTHNFTHTGERRYQCTICDAKFLQLGALSVHLKKVHYGEKRFQCAQCPMTFLFRSDMLVHTKRVHEKYRLYLPDGTSVPDRTYDQLKPHKCTNCYRGFTTPFSMRRHMKLYCNTKKNAERKFELLEDSKFAEGKIEVGSSA